MNKRLLMLIAGVASTTLLTLGNTSYAASQNLNIGLEAVPRTLDPVKYTGTYESDVMMNIFNTLVYYDKDLKSIIPGLATQWQVSPDLKEYTFTLRDDVYFQPGKFQPGRKMTAEDVRYSLLRSAKESVMKRARMVQDVQVLSPTQVKVTLSQPNAAFLAVLTDIGNAIVPQEEVTGQGDGFGLHPVGTGPFLLKEWNKDEKISLARFDKYFDHDVKLNKVVWKFIPDLNMMTNALLTGEIDIASNIDGPNRKTVQDNDKTRLLSVPGMNITFSAMNLKDGPTKDVRVRQAILKAVNVNDIVSGIFQWGGGTRSYSPLPKSSWGYWDDANSTAMAQDLEGAKKLMAEAGYANGFQATLVTPQDPDRIKAATIMQQQLKSIGIDLSIKSMEWGSFSESVTKGQPTFYNLSWSWYPDPDFFLYQMFSSKQIGSLGNGQGYSNPDVDTLLTAAVGKSSDQQERRALYQQVQQKVLADSPRVELWTKDFVNGVSRKVQGYQVSPDGLLRIATPDTHVTVNK
ncbi:ABC transporter substrate-binding protein [Musicola paradisiaca]|uniref:Extracellular solute-binding protein family 5 n=1 Tax=Musicola paradisiaca (strain Ech703) TaxID=579405 RepID=C6C7G2_MUSP7|nr:ABC transporter substrate-binding protein [Musicola paradisiaca]ACS84080.1 extracellular solute-binding protein family 5 [Musicola paradisiaca Ech703]